MDIRVYSLARPSAPVTQFCRSAVRSTILFFHVVVIPSVPLLSQRQRMYVKSRGRLIADEGCALTSRLAAATLFMAHVGVIMKARKFALLAFICTLWLATDLLSAQEPQHHPDADEK